MGTSQDLRATRRKNKRIAAQIIAVNTLHREIDGRCVHCNVEAPCPTRTVTRAARRLVAGDDGPRVDPRTAGETAVANYLGVDVSEVAYPAVDAEQEGAVR